MWRCIACVDLLKYYISIYQMSSNVSIHTKSLIFYAEYALSLNSLNCVIQFVVATSELFLLDNLIPALIRYLSIEFPSILATDKVQ